VGGVADLVALEKYFTVDRDFSGRRSSAERGFPGDRKEERE